MKVRQRGFTLLELLVVLAIVGLALTVVPPMIAGSLPGAELKAAAREVAASLRFARGLAIGQNRSVAVVFDVQAHSIRVGGRPRIRQLPRDLELRLDTAESEQIDEHTGAIRYFADGSSTGGGLVLSHGEQRYVVNSHWLTGLVSIQ